MITLTTRVCQVQGIVTSVRLGKPLLRLAAKLNGGQLKAYGCLPPPRAVRSHAASVRPGNAAIQQQAIDAQNFHSVLFFLSHLYSAANNILTPLSSLLKGVAEARAGIQ